MHNSSRPNCGAVVFVVCSIKEVFKVYQGCFIIRSIRSICCRNEHAYNLTGRIDVAFPTRARVWKRMRVDIGADNMQGYVAWIGVRV